ncbi:hypothetical protein MMC10_000946 [Thelotrema lepadinum]|nr:hypothetical protein [Thelotrema lepadinum]
MADKSGPQGPEEGSVQPDNGSIINSANPLDNVQLRPRRPNYNQIHAQPLPLTIYPLPPLIPHNPLSLLHIAFVYLRQVIWKPSSIPEPKYIGYFSSETRSVHVTDPASVRALWEHGFFGKGSLSRSEPTWLDREKKRLGLLAEDTSEEYTLKRREERRQFKMERARKEREAIEETLKGEQNGVLKLGPLQQAPVDRTLSGDQAKEEALGRSSTSPEIQKTDQSAVSANLIVKDLPTPLMLADEAEEPINEEHLQLTLPEAFFLTFSLGILTVNSSTTNTAIPTQDLLAHFVSHSVFPPSPLPPPFTPIDPSSPFLISYVAYHHFRSLGWVVRPGIKFSVDLLLYLRGPAFTHAEFAVSVVPAFEHQYWKEKRRGKGMEWHHLHAVNRVQAQVRKTLVLCYVEVPPPLAEVAGEGERVGDLEGVKRLLRRYKVRKFVVRRWVPNRMRD